MKYQRKSGQRHGVSDGESAGMKSEIMSIEIMASAIESNGMAIMAAASIMASISMARNENGGVNMAYQRRGENNGVMAMKISA
jgi:hypothetical protein